MTKQNRRAGRNNNERRGGQRGNTRGKPDKQLSRRRHREQQTRVREAKEAKERAERKLAELAEQPADAPTPGAIYAREKRAQAERERREAEEAARIAALPPYQKRLEQQARLVPPSQRGEKGWSMGQARSMLRQGYLLAQVIVLTGWGRDHFADLPLDNEGRGLSTEAWAELEARRARKKPGGLSA